jgi:hypothetical protein
MQLNTSGSFIIFEGYNGDAAGDIVGLFGKDWGLMTDRLIYSQKNSV